MRFTLSEHEQIIKKGPANLKKQYEFAGGFLYLINTGRLIHVPHKINFQTGIVEIRTENVVEIKTGWTIIFGVPLTPNALIISLDNGETYRYVVYGKEKWKSAINTLIDKTSKRTSK